MGGLHSRKHSHMLMLFIETIMPSLGTYREVQQAELGVKQAHYAMQTIDQQSLGPKRLQHVACRSGPRSLGIRGDLSGLRKKRCSFPFRQTKRKPPFWGVSSWIVRAVFAGLLSLQVCYRMNTAFFVWGNHGENYTKDTPVSNWTPLFASIRSFQ